MLSSKRLTEITDMLNENIFEYFNLEESEKKESEVMFSVLIKAQKFYTQRKLKNEDVKIILKELRKYQYNKEYVELLLSKKNEKFLIDYESELLKDKKLILYGMKEDLNIKLDDVPHYQKDKEIIMQSMKYNKIKDKDLLNKEEVKRMYRNMNKEDREILMDYLRNDYRTVKKLSEEIELSKEEENRILINTFRCNQYNVREIITEKINEIFSIDEIIELLKINQYIYSELNTTNRYNKEILFYILNQKGYHEYEFGEEIKDIKQLSNKEWLKEKLMEDIKRYKYIDEELSKDKELLNILLKNMKEDTRIESKEWINEIIGSNIYINKEGLKEAIIILDKQNEMKKELKALPSEKKVIKL